MSTTITLTRPATTATSSIILTKAGVFPVSTLRTSLTSMGEMIDQTTGQNSSLASEPELPSTEKAAMVPSASFNFTPTVISAPVSALRIHSTVTGLSPELDYLESVETAKLLVELQQRYARPSPEESSISAAQPSTSKGKGKGRKRARASRAGGSSASKRRKVTTAEGEVSAVGTGGFPAETESSESTSDVASTSAQSSSSSLTSLTSDTTSQAPSRVASARRRRSAANPPEPSSIVARVKQSALEKAQAKAAKALAEAQAEAESA